VRLLTRCFGLQQTLLQLLYLTLTTVVSWFAADAYCTLLCGIRPAVGTLLGYYSSRAVATMAAMLLLAAYAACRAQPYTPSTSTTTDQLFLPLQPIIPHRVVVSHMCACLLFQVMHEIMRISCFHAARSCV
jgi:hypothetical protein